MAKTMDRVVLVEPQKEAKKARKKSGGRNKAISQDKENLCVFHENVFADGQVVSRSPLPPDYPRIPLQDITAVLSPANVMQDEEGENSSASLPMTRSKTRKSVASWPLRYELNIVEKEKAVTPEVLCQKTIEDLAQATDLKGITILSKGIDESQLAVSATKCDKDENEGQQRRAPDDEDCAPVRQQQKRRRPQQRAPAAAERSTSMLKFR